MSAGAGRGFSWTRLGLSLLLLAGGGLCAWQHGQDSEERFILKVQEPAVAVPADVAVCRERQAVRAALLAEVQRQGLTAELARGEVSVKSLSGAPGAGEITTGLTALVTAWNSAADRQEEVNLAAQKSAAGRRESLAALRASLAGLEALAAKLPVATTDAGGSASQLSSPSEAAAVAKFAAEMLRLRPRMEEVFGKAQAALMQDTFEKLVQSQAAETRRLEQAISAESSALAAGLGRLRAELAELQRGMLRQLVASSRLQLAEAESRDASMLAPVPPPRLQLEVMSGPTSADPARRILVLTLLSIFILNLAWELLRRPQG